MTSPSENESEREEYGIFFSSNPHPMYVYDLESLAFVKVNQAAIEQYGYTEEEFLKLKLTEIRPSEDVPRLVELIGGLREDRDKAGVWKHLRKDGSLIHAEVTTVAMTYAGRPCRIVMALDVTESICTAEELERSKSLLQMASRIGKLGAWAVHLPDMRHEWSDATRRIHGVEPGQKPSLEDLFDFYHPGHKERLQSAFSSCLRTGYPFDDEYLFTNAEGHTLWVRVIGEALRDVAGRIVCVQGAIQDIDEQRKAEQSLHTTLESITDAFITLNPEWKFTYINTHAETLLERHRSDLLGRGIWEEFPEAVNGVSYREYHRAMREKETVDFSEYYSPLGKWFQARAYPSAEGIAVYFRDVTEEKKLQEQVLRSQRMESIGTLAGGIAHDLNNILTPVVMGMGLLRELHGGGASTDVIAEIESNARRGAELVRQVLTFARGTPGERISLPLSSIIRDLDVIIRSTFPKNIELHLGIAKDLAPVLGDPTQIHQVLVNLAVNARDAMPSGGSLKIRAANLKIEKDRLSMYEALIPGDYVMIEVEDTGEGMPDEVKSRIFEPFFTTKPQGEGTGLGLSTSLGIVRSHGGMIHAYSTPGTGSVFRVFLPASRAAVSSSDSAEAQMALPRGEGQLILLIDDESSIRDITTQLLEKFGYRVLSASDGADGVTVYVKHKN